MGRSLAPVMFASSYWGLHIAFYGVEGQMGPPVARRATHSYSPEYPHGPMAPSGIGAPPNQ